MAIRHGVFTLLSFAVTQGFDLFRQCLSGFDYHPNKGVPGFPIEAVVAGTVLGTGTIILHRRRRDSHVQNPKARQLSENRYSLWLHCILRNKYADDEEENEDGRNNDMAQLSLFSVLP